MKWKASPIWFRINLEFQNIIEIGWNRKLIIFDRILKHNWNMMKYEVNPIWFRNNLEFLNILELAWNRKLILFDLKFI